MDSPRNPYRRPAPRPDEEANGIDSALANTDLHTPAQSAAFLPAAIELPSGVPGRPIRVTQLGPYRLVRELGSGGMGLVYEALDTGLNRRVALKILRPNLPSEQSARDRFLREARAMASLSHDNVVAVYHVGEEQSLSYMAMPLLEGETLEKRLDREGRLPVADAVRVGREVAAGLAAAHDKGLIHRDVKPSNVWLEANTGRVKLLDFGLALAGDNTHLTNSGFVIGTPSYMSPEQARGESLDGRSDLFSLGAVLYRLVTGERPFEGATALAIMRNLELHQPARPTLKRPDVPAPFSNLVMELLAKDRKDRPAGAADVANRLARPEMARLSHVPVAPGGSASGVRPAVSMPAGQMSGIYERQDYAAHSHTTIRTIPSRQPQPVTRVFLFLVACGLVMLPAWYFIFSNYGELGVETDLTQVEVQIRQGSDVKHVAAGAQKFELRPGVYDVVLTKPKTGYRLSRSTVEIRRGVHEVVRVNKDVAMP